MANKEFSTVEAVSERTTGQYACRFRDAAVGAPVLNAAAILTITATLKDSAGTVLNGRTAQNVKNANGGVLANDGLFTLSFVAADHTMATGNTQPFDARRLTLQVTYTGAGDVASELRHEVRYFVRNLADVA